jgi:peptidoglycan DL-endopeptidase CwlO
MRATTSTQRPSGPRLVGALVLAIVLAAATAAVSAAGPTQQDLTDAKARLRELHHTLDQLVEDYDAARIKLRAVESRLADTREAADLAQAAADRARATLNDRARAAYEGVGAGIDVLLGAASFTDFNESLVFLDQVAQMDVDAAARADTTRGQAQEAAARLRESLRQRRDLLDDMAAKQKDIEASIADQQALIDQLSKELTQQALQQVLSQPGSKSSSSNGGGSEPPPPPPPPPPPAQGAATAVQAAYSVIGVPYKWGGDDPEEGFDCSGMTMWSWAQAGVSLPHSSSAQYASIPHVSKDAIQPGDLLFFYQPISHVGMYVGNNQMIHATHPGSTVVLETLASYWWDVFTGAGRPG